MIYKNRFREKVGRFIFQITRRQKLGSLGHDLKMSSIKRPTTTRTMIWKTFLLCYFLFVHVPAEGLTRLSVDWIFYWHMKKKKETLSQ